jgi:basic amino acid/polyamine antiporter, APA family
VIFGSVTFETLAIATIFVFRRRIPVTPENRPYKCWGYPVVPAVYVLVMAAVMVSMFLDPEKRWKAWVGLGFIAVGAAVYFLAFGRKR